MTSGSLPVVNSPLLVFLSAFEIAMRPQAKMESYVSHVFTSLRANLDAIGLGFPHRTK
jgi:hypothetical protein